MPRPISSSSVTRRVSTQFSRTITLMTWSVELSSASRAALIHSTLLRAAQDRFAQIEVDGAQVRLRKGDLPTRRKLAKKRHSSPASLIFRASAFGKTRLVVTLQAARCHTST